MTEARSRFIRLLEMRGLSPNSIEAYVLAVASISRFYNKSPLLLTNEEISGFLVHEAKVRHLSPRSINLHSHALKTFFRLMAPDSRVMDGVPRMKEPRRLPIVLSRAEVLRLIDTLPNLKHKAMVTLLYSAGLRVSECASLKVADIDSARMAIRVQNGKGGKDRYAMLSRQALETLRTYYRLYRPADWLFEGQGRGHLNQRSLQRVVKQAGRKAGIPKRVGPHTFRHSFATHLIEAGTPLPCIQHFLGHASINSTAHYTHLSTTLLSTIKSPLDEAPPPATAPEAVYA